jgi:prefoldin subunit 5
MAKIHQEVLRAQYFAVKSLSRNRGVNGGTDLAFSSPIPDLKSLVEMAQSPGVLGKVFDSQSETGTAQEERVFGEFSGGLVAEALGKDQIQLKVTDTDPKRAASIANAWARNLTQLINASFSPVSLAQTLTPQIQKTYESYQQAQAKLEQALKESQVDALQARLKSKQDELASVLASLTRTQRVLNDLATLEKQLSGQSPEATLPLNYGLALLTLQQRALTGTSESFTVQVDSASFANFTVAQALETIAAMRTALQGQLQSLQEQQRRIEQEIPQLQSELTKASAELNEFFIQRDQAASLYKALLSYQQLVQTLQDSSPGGSCERAGCATPKGILASHRPEHPPRRRSGADAPEFHVTYGAGSNCHCYTRFAGACV